MHLPLKNIKIAEKPLKKQKKLYIPLKIIDR